MRAYAAAIGSDADHDVIQVGVGNEAELLHKLGGSVAMHVCALNQQAPVRLIGFRQASKWAIFHVLFTILAPNQARFYGVVAGQLSGGGN